MKPDEAEKQTALMVAVIETLKELEEYGGLPAVCSTKKKINRYNERIATDKEFRDSRLIYYKDYYQKNKDRIKVRNYQKYIRSQNENIHLR
jgi:hypothetical protein